MSWRPTRAERDAARGAAYAALRRGHVPPSVNVADLEQAALIALWQSRARRAELPGIEPTLPAKWAVYDELRRQTRPDATRVAFDPDVHAGAHHDTPDAHLGALQAIRVLGRRLSARQREVLEAVVDCDTFEAAARRLGITGPAISAHLQRVRELLAAAV